MKSTLAITAGCLIAALAVGDTVYRIAPRPGRSYPDVAVATKGNLGDISQLTDQDDEDAMAKSLDDLFADATRDGIDAEELSSLRELAMIAKPHDSSWGEDFFKSEDGKVGGASTYAMASTTSAWDSTLGTNMATSATSGPMSYIATGGSPASYADQFSLAGSGGGSVVQYGGDASGVSGGGGSSSQNHPAVILSSLSATPAIAVPEPTTASVFAIGALSLLSRKRRSR